MCECSGGLGRLVSSRSFLLQFESHWVCRSDGAHQAVGEWIPSEVGRVKGRENPLEVDCVVSVVRRAKVKVVVVVSRRDASGTGMSRGVAGPSRWRRNVMRPARSLVNFERELDSG